MNNYFETNETHHAKVSENAQWLLEQRYFLDRIDPDTGEITKEKTIQELAMRVARTIAASETEYTDSIQRIREIERGIFLDIVAHRFLFNSPCLFNAGRGLTTTEVGKLLYKDQISYEDYVKIKDSKTSSQQLFACFVIGIEDSLEGIFDSVKDAAIISKHGGGVGTNFSRLRESGAGIKEGVAGKASGPVSFMETWDTMGSVVVQGGCFVGDTLIAAPGGPKKIKDLEEGDLVYAWDGEFKVTPCSGSWVTKRNAEVWKAFTHNGLTIKATPDHPFLLEDSTSNDKKYVKLCESYGRNLISFDIYRGDNVINCPISKILHVGFSHYEDVYNIEVPGPHNYVVCNEDMSTGIVVSNTRRSALMGMLDIDHPDINIFMNAKTEDGKLPYFNISVAITDDFMAAVKDDKEFNLISRVDGKVVRTVKARSIWDTLCQKAWERGDPGIFFKDTANGDNLLKADRDWDTSATNPCCTGDTLVATPDGLVMAKDLSVGDTITTVVGTGVIDEMEEHHNCPVYKIEFSDGGHVKVTKSHRFQAIKSGTIANNTTPKWEFIKLEDLSVGDFVRVCPTNNLPNNKIETYGLSDRDFGFLVGVLIGDGYMTDKLLARDRVRVSASKDDKDWLDHLTGFYDRVGIRYALHEERTVFNLCSNGDKRLLAIIKDLGIAGYSHDKNIPLSFINSNRDVLVGFLDGYFSCDGNVLNNKRKLVRVSSVNKPLLESVRHILLMFGIHTSFYTTKRDSSVIEGRLVNSRDKHELIMSGGAIDIFFRNITLSRKHKQASLFDIALNYSNTGGLWKSRIKSIEYAGEDTVYDFHEPVSDTWITNGYVSQGCGEQPLPDYTSCNLGSINLSEFVSDGEFDMEAFKAQIHRSIYYLDLVIDSTSFPLERIKDRTRSIRPLGLGIMGLADAGIKMGMVYGSDEFCEFCDDIGHVMSIESISESIRLADIKGEFPESGLVRDLYSNDLPSPRSIEIALSDWTRDDIQYLREQIRKGHLRNSRRLSIAPTGSISMIFDSSPGIEPNFAWRWSRKVTDPNNPEGYATRSYYHPLLTDEAKAELDKDIPVSDPRFVSAHDVSVDDHVKVVGIFATYIDSGISKTVNLPESATVEDVKRVYEKCYELGCKGITIYRDGSRTGQPIETKPTESPKGAMQKAKDRPHGVVHGKTIKDKTPWGSLYVTVNYDAGQPFEVFASLGKSGSEMKSMTEAVSRILSIGLRSGCDIADLIETIRGISGKEVWMFDCDDQKVVRSIPDAIAILLGKIIGEDVKGDKGEIPCPECGAPMELVGGCAYCFSCGYSPCK